MTVLRNLSRFIGVHPPRKQHPYRDEREVAAVFELLCCYASLHYHDGTTQWVYPRVFFLTFEKRGGKRGRIQTKRTLVLDVESSFWLTISAEQRQRIKEEFREIANATYVKIRIIETTGGRAA